MKYLQSMKKVKIINFSFLYKFKKLRIAEIILRNSRSMLINENFLNKH